MLAINLHQSRIKQLFLEHLHLDEAQYLLTANIVEDLGGDSLDTVELVMAFEEAFNVEITDEEAAQLITVGDAVAFVKSRVAAGGLSNAGNKPKKGTRRSVRKDENP